MTRSRLESYDVDQGHNDHYSSVTFSKYPINRVPYCSILHVRERILFSQTTRLVSYLWVGWHCPCGRFCISPMSDLRRLEPPSLNFFSGGNRPFDVEKKCSLYCCTFRVPCVWAHNFDLFSFPVCFVEVTWYLSSIKPKLFALDVTDRCLAETQVGKLHDNRSLFLGLSTQCTPSWLSRTSWNHNHSCWNCQVCLSASFLHCWRL